MSSTKDQQASIPADSTSDPNSTNNPTLPKAKLSAFARFKSFSGLKSAPEPSFPPSTWDLSGSPQSGTGASDWDQKSEQYKAGLERWRAEVKALTVKEEAEKNKNDAAEDAEQTQDAPETDTRTLAVKIKALIDEKFTFAGKSHQSAPSTPGPNTSSTTPTGTRSANPSGPATPSAGTANSSTSIFGGLDATLAQLLSSESIMNGEVGKGLEKGRESVWAMLDKLGAIAGASGNSTTVNKGKERATDQNQTSEHPIHEEEGIMMYTPLQPTKDLEPEVADSELEYAEEEATVAGPSTDTETYPTKTAESASVPAAAVEDKPAPTGPKPKRVFYPSSTKLSLEVTWWGYRLFLPPPVIAQLSSAHIASAKRGAMITAALKWLVDQVPLMVFPIQLRPGLLMLKRMSPFLGYIGAFVAWSWSRVQSKDEGQGVVLTATWLLPIAILPATWDYDVHGRPRDLAVDPRKTPTPAERTASVSGDTAAQGSSVTDGKDASSTSVNTTLSNVGTQPTTASESLFSSASRRWSSLRGASSTKEKTV